MDKVRLAMVGTGSMGCYHLDRIGDIPEIELAGVCDFSADQAHKVAEKYKTHAFTDYKELVRKDRADAVMIVTPHYFHPPIAVWAFEQGVHVLCEKPIAVTVGEAQKWFDAHREHPDLKFGVVFHFRMSPLWNKVRQLIVSGELGQIHRIAWTITDWYRTQAYYNSGGWRGTWKGEGGGVLMNQCPHQLDLLQWLFGMPKRVSAVCRFGRYHKVEIEDDVTAILEYADGRTLTFVTSTGEYPGTNRLEICCNRGRVVIEKGTILFDRAVSLVSDYTMGSSEAWSKPEYWSCEVPYGGEDPARKGIIRDFVNVILGRESEVAAPGPEGINSLMLANAMVYSGVRRQAVELPLAAEEYDKLLAELVAGSK